MTGPASKLSLAIRWHGPNAAVLWDVEGEPVTLTTGVATEPWWTSVPRGEALWGADRMVAPRRGVQGAATTRVHCANGRARRNPYSQADRLRWR